MPIPWVERPAYELDLDRPPRDRYADIPDDVRAAGIELMNALRAEGGDAAKTVGELARLRTLGTFHAEAKAIAEQLGVERREVMLANCTYDIVMNSLFCSTVALPGPDGPVLARNMDFWPERELARTSSTIVYTRAGRPRFWIAGWPGTIGVVSGMSSNGFAIALNAVTCGERPPPTGYPVMLHLRRVLEDAAGFDDAVRMIETQTLAAPCMVTIVGTQNDQRAVIERTPRRAEIRWGEPDRALVTTNDYRKLDEANAETNTLASTACGRFDALTAFFASDPPNASSDEALLYILSEPTVKMAITAQQMVFRPSAQRMRLVSPREFFE